MRKINSIAMLTAAAAMAFASCTKDLTSDSSSREVGDRTGNLSYQLTAQLDDATRASIGADGKMAWEATDSIGLVVKGINQSDLNLAARTDEVSCQNGVFYVTTGAVAQGTLYAYYPWTSFSNPTNAQNTYGGELHISENEIWSVIPQLQVQSEANVNEAGKYMTMVAEGIEFDSQQHPTLDFTAVGSVICLDIYDATGTYSTETVKSVIVGSPLDTDAPLVGGFKYDLAGKSIDMTSSYHKYAGKVELATPFAVPSAAGTGKVYMAVWPGEHTFQVRVNTDMGTHVFNLSSSETCSAGKIGTIRLNLGNANVLHYLLYQPFDLLCFGADMMYTGNVGYNPNKGTNEVGAPTTATESGEQPYFFANTDLSLDGSADFSSMNEYFLRSRDVVGWEFYKSHEHPGYLKLGTSSVGYKVTTPKLAGVKQDGEAIQFSFDIARRHATTVATRISVIGGGNIEGKEYVQINPETPTDANDVRNHVEHYVFILYNFTPESQVVIENDPASKSNTRCQIDNIIMERPELIPLSPVDATKITKSVTETSFTLTWAPVEHATAYTYSVSVEGTMLASGVATDTTLTFNEFEPGYSFEVGITAVSDDEMYEASEVTKYYVAVDNHEEGFVFLEESFSYFDATFYSNWASGDVDCRLLDKDANYNMLKWGYSTPNNLTYEAHANRIYARIGCLKFGRAKNSDGCNGELVLPASMLVDVPKGAEVDITITGKVFGYQSAGGTKDQFAELCAQAKTNDILGDIASYDTKSFAYAPASATWDDGFKVELKNVTCDSWIHIFTRKGSSVAASRIFLDDLKVAKSEKPKE